MSKAKYFSLDGQALIRKVVNGVFQGPWMHMGNQPTIAYELTSETKEITESMSSKRLPFISYPVSNGGTFTSTMQNLEAEMLAVMSRGTAETDVGDTVAAENIGTVVAGDWYPLEYQNVSALVITDSAGAPATLVKDVNYTIDPTIGLIEFVDVEDFTMPLSAAYTYGASETVALFTAPAGEYAVRYLGKNKVPGGKKMVIGFHKIQFDPKGFELISEELNAVSTSGKILADLTKAEDAELGQFGYVRIVG